MEKRGLKYAIGYLNGFYPIALVPEELKCRAGCNIMTETLGRKLRANTNREEPPKGRVIAEHYVNADGQRVTRYKGNPGWTYQKPAKASPRPAQAPCWFFYSNGVSVVPSPLFPTLAALKASPGYQVGFALWTGSHEAPVPFDYEGEDK